MNQDYIKQRIAKIRKLISEARHIEAFDDLENFMIEMDGEEVENARERELLNQLIAIKSRFSLFNKKMLQGMQEDNIELNQITASLLLLTDSIKNLADENPAIFIPTTAEKKSKSYSANMAIDPDASKTTVGINELSKDGSENSGCLNILSDDKKSNNLVSIIKAVSPILLLSILLVGLFFIIRGFEGCEKTLPPIDPPVGPNKERPTEETATLGKTGKELGLGTNNSISKMADNLSASRTKIPKEFTLDKVSFSKNSTTLNAATKQQLKDLAVVLKAYNKANFDIFGFMKSNEKSKSKAKKESGLTLDVLRAQAIRDYLITLDISENRITAEGNGIQENINPLIRILNR